MFANAQMLYHLLWAVPLTTALIILTRRRRARILSAFYSDDAQAGRASMAVSRGARLFRGVMIVLTIAGIGVAIAGPRWGTEGKRDRTVGCDVLILLDLSKSMLARDSKPDRITYAKSLVDELLTQLPESRFGIIAFAGTAYSVVPLTTSQDSVRMILDDLDPMDQPYGGSHLEEALKTLMERQPVSGSSFAPVVILSDGEELDGSAKALIPKLKERGFTIFSVGIGDPSLKSRIQLPDNTFVTYKGQPVRTRLNPEALQALATQTDGMYLHADMEPLVMEKVADVIRRKMKVGVRTDSGMRPTERFQWVLAAAITFLFLRLLMSERRLAPAAAIIACMCMPLNGAADAEAQSLTELQEIVENTTDPRLKARRSFVLALRLQHEGAVGEAEALYKALLLSANTSAPLRSRTLQNLGAIHHAQADDSFKDDPKAAIGLFAKATRFYRAALVLRQDTDLVKNLKWAVLRLAQAEERLKILEDRRKRKKEAIRQLISARDSRARADAQPTSDDDNDLALKMTLEGGKTAGPLNVEGLADAIDSAAELQRKFRDTSVMEERRTYGTKAMKDILEALRLLGVRDPKNQKKPPQEGDPNQSNKGDFKKAPTNLPEGLQILRELAKKERDARREVMKSDGPHKRVGRREEKDW